MPSLGSPIETILRINKRIIPALKRLGIKTIRDFLFYFPSRYDDYSNLKKIREVGIGETVTVQGVIKKITNRRTAKKRMFLTEATVEDESGKITALWFNQPFLSQNLKMGSFVNLSGKVALGKYGIYLQSPAHEKLSSPNDQISNIHTGGLVAIYPETGGISSRWLRYLIKTFIPLRNQIRDPLPKETKARHRLPDIQEAILKIHFPQTLNESEQAQKRFAFEELLLIQLRALRERLKLNQQRAPEIKFDLQLIKQLVASLLFELTDAQRRSMWEIFQDLSKPRPMNRLLEGDVGSGKTVVAAAAALLTTKSGYKVAYMAPTEILARQHFETFSKILSPFEVRMGLLVGAEKKMTPETQITIGTHALIQKGVKLQNLGLIIVDEQHRFGVEQRAKLLRKDQGEEIPHFLSMSATPIPRTLALSIYGDLDISILDEMPKDRKPIITKIIEPTRREEAYRFIRDEVKRGRQVFVICPRIEKSANNEFSTNLRIGESLWGNLELKAVKEEYEKLSKHVFPDLRVGMLHGKMKSKEKELVMNKFSAKGGKNHKIDILVSTSVVEVGVDIPNASIMMIEGAERFGLSQLHQFRGRVGRGRDQSYCMLFPSEDGMAAKRLRAVVEAKNGFDLAKIDLEIRGPGDIFGIKQWGVPNEILNAFSDAKLVRAVRTEAIELIKKDPTLAVYPTLQERLQRMESEVHLE